MEDKFNAHAYVELFHLLFMEVLSQKLDKRLYALKGGCNLRFFFGSVRYSEDIDLDVHTVAVETLTKLVTKILEGTPFKQILLAQKLEIVEFSTPKQTSTTQRWKVQLKVPQRSLPINTKIEFSRRGKVEDTVTEVISKAMTITYGTRPIFITHYTALSALRQKINALIHRSQTQARDVFDIYHLLQTQKSEKQQTFSSEELKTAIENAMNISFAMFKAQVVSYLEPQYQSQFKDETLWDHVLSSVIEYIDRGAL